MDLGLQERVALVLGAGGGLGSAIATRLAEEGARVAAADIDEEALHGSAAPLAAAGGRSMTVLWDISDLGVLDERVGQIEQALGPVDILINNTGGPPPSAAAGIEPPVWRKQFDAMVVSVIAITDRVLPAMRRRAWGRIITSTSSGVIAPIPSLALSNALRLSLVGWSKTLSREVAREGLTVNIVAPGRIATARTRSLDEAKGKREGRTVAEVMAESTAAIAMGRYGDPQEYADVVAFLASTRASYITGSVVRVDGGLIPSI